MGRHRRTRLPLRPCYDAMLARVQIRSRAVTQASELASHLSGPVCHVREVGSCRTSGLCQAARHASRRIRCTKSTRVTQCGGVRKDTMRSVGALTAMVVARVCPCLQSVFRLETSQLHVRFPLVDARGPPRRGDSRYEQSRPQKGNLGCRRLFPNQGEVEAQFHIAARDWSGSKYRAQDYE